MKVVAIVQARMGSTRLPGKVLMDISGRPMLWHVLTRLSFARSLSEVWVATTTSCRDDQLAALSSSWGYHCFRGSEDDVLSRYYHAALTAGASVVVRVTSDCPLIDPEVTDRVIKTCIASGADYASNIVERTYPRGLDVEAFRFDALARAHREATKPYEREHVTPYIWQNPSQFKIVSVGAEENLRRPELRLTVDTEDDLALVREIYRRLYEEGRVFGIHEVLELLDSEPHLARINAHVKQKPLKGS